MNSRSAAALVLGVLVMSTAALLVRHAQAEGVPSLAIAAWRLGLAALLLLPFWWWRERRPWSITTGTQRALLAASGAFLALHFAAWIASLAYTSVASSVALVTTNPIWIVLFSVFVQGRRIPLLRAFAVVLAIAGSGVVLFADATPGGSAGAAPMFGNALALLGSMAICGYLLLGERLRAQLSLLGYIGPVYAAAAVLLFVCALASGTPLAGYSAAAWGALALLAIGPQLIGHGAINYALKNVSPTLIALAVLGEPVGSAVLAWFFLNEAVGALKFVGIALLLSGIALAAHTESKKPQDH